MHLQLPDEDTHAAGDERTLITVGELARQLGLNVHQVQYLIKTRGIEPIGRAGIARVFSAGTIDVLREELARGSNEAPRVF